MVAQKTKRMPRGVGKRIIESIKNNEADIGQEENFENDSEETTVEIEATEEADKIENNEEEELECDMDEEYEGISSNHFTCKPKSKDKNTYSSDIDTLLRLISKLPSGVTKQTGALIIRQTMEAMGISMNNVLSNAQSVQEGLENSIRNNVNVIEEYRTKIKILEQEIQKFRKKSHELEDIISLFILSDDKKEI